MRRLLDLIFRRRHHCQRALRGTLLLPQLGIVREGEIIQLCHPQNGRPATLRAMGRKKRAWRKSEASKEIDQALVEAAASSRAEAAPTEALFFEDRGGVSWAATLGGTPRHHPAHDQETSGPKRGYGRGECRSAGQSRRGRSNAPFSDLPAQCGPRASSACPVRPSD